MMADHTRESDLDASGSYDGEEVTVEFWNVVRS